MAMQTFVVIAHDTVNDCIMVKEVEGPNEAFVRFVFGDQYPPSCADIVSIMSSDQCEREFH